MTSASGQSALAPWRQAATVLALIGVIALLGTLAATPDETETLSLPVLLPALLLVLATAFAARDRTSPGWQSTLQFASIAMWTALAAILLTAAAQILPRALAALPLSSGTFAPGGAITAGALAGLAAWIAPRRTLEIALATATFAVLCGAFSGSGLLAAASGTALSAALTLTVLLMLARRGRVPAPGDPSLRPLLDWPSKPFRSPGAPADPGHPTRIWIITGIILAAAILFLAVPSLDLRTSALFYDPTRGFTLNVAPRTNDLRGVFEAMIFATALIPLILWSHALRDPGRTQIPHQVWGFATFAMLLGPGLLANEILKNNWGRARPADITQFGGTADFSLPFQITDQCARNCSFVSGEGSGIAMAAIVLLTLAWPAVRHRPWPWLALVCLPAALGISLRVMKGRHFLSDTVFAILLMALVAAVLYRWFAIRQHRKAITTRALFDDIAATLDYLWPGGQGVSLWRDLLHLGRSVPMALGAAFWQGSAEPKAGGTQDD